MDKKNLTFQFFQRSHLLKMEDPSYQKTVNDLFQWLLVSDDFSHDKTSEFVPAREIRAEIIAKQQVVVAGMEEIAFLLRQERDVMFEIKLHDGQQAEQGQAFAVIIGNSRKILALERTILNILQRMSGIATTTKNYIGLVNSETSFIAATRKAPWTLLDKKAVAIGGGLTHRLNLADGILVKDNHLEVMEREFGLHSEEEAVRKALEMILSKSQNILIEIETNTPAGAEAAISEFQSMQNGNCLAVMLDNWEPEKAGEFIKTFESRQENLPVLFEASGNINEKNIADWAKTGVQVISLGALTHSVKAADLSLDVK